MSDTLDHGAATPAAHASLAGYGASLVPLLSLAAANGIALTQMHAAAPAAPPKQTRWTFVVRRAGQH